ncbi:MAG TPA: PAS domain S-box protein [Acidobacteriota bacterium]|nr:PAS domain S-box protein [Acidobacteriota bacterium]
MTSSLLSPSSDSGQILLESQEHLQLALQAANAGTWEFHPETGVFLASDRALALHGLQPGTTVTHEQALQAVHPGHRPLVEESFRRTLQTGAPLRVEFCVSHSDGAVRWLASSAELRNGPGGLRLVGLVQDITEHKQAEAALRESEERLRLVVEGASMGIWDVDMKTGVGLWSARHYQIMGYQPDSGPSNWEKWRSRVYSKDLDRVMEARKSASETHGFYSPEHRIVRADNGEIRWVQPFARFIYNEDGQAVRFVGVDFDITERKRAEEALRESEEIFRATFENAAVGIAHVSPDGQWLKVNDKLCQILGYTREQLLTMTSQEITHPDDVDAKLALLKRAVDGEIQTYAMEQRYFRSDGSIVWAKLTKSLVRQQQTNEPLYFISVVEDITPRKQAENELRESEERLRLALDGGSLGTWHRDMVTDEVIRDERACVILGLPTESDRGSDFFDAVHPDDREKLLAARCHAIAEQRELAAEFRVIRPDGSIVWVLNKSKPYYDEAGKVVRVSGICMDITDRKSAEQKLHEITQQLESRVEERTAELKSTQEQLRALASRLHLLQEEERAQLARELHDEFGAALTALKVDLHWIMARLPKKVAGIEKKAQVMSDLIDNSVESIRRTAALLRPRLLDDFGLAAAIEWQLQEFHRRTGIRCVTRLPDEVDLDHATATAVFRILQEALTNVARHAKATEVHVGLQKDASKVLLEVNDNGIGIDLDTDFNSNSLGLFGMQERAYAFGGHVRFECRRHHGTTVTVEIPLKNQA